VGRLALGRGPRYRLRAGSVGAFPRLRLAADLPCVILATFGFSPCASLCSRHFLLRPVELRCDVDHAASFDEQESRSLLAKSLVWRSVGIAFGWVTVGLLSALGFSLPARQPSLMCSLRALADRHRDRMATPPSPADELRRPACAGSAHADAAGCSRSISRAMCSGVASAMPAFWLAVVIVGLPP